jgi:hypothetical protein
LVSCRAILFADGGFRTTNSSPEKLPKDIVTKPYYWTESKNALRKRDTYYVLKRVEAQRLEPDNNLSQTSEHTG